MKPPAADRAPPAAPSEPWTGLLPEEVEARLLAWGEPRYRAAQVVTGLWRDGAEDPAAVRTLPRALRDRLAREAPPRATRVLEVRRSADGTVKSLLGLRDGRRVETVLIPEGARRTVCVSTQVGCAIACTFCASGVGGVVRDLGAAEIAEQALAAGGPGAGRPTHVVVMGMGEPLFNLPALARAVLVWTHRAALGLSPRRITVSTAATPAGVDRLAAEDLGVHLAVSLHAPDDETRARLVPGSPAGRVQALVDAAARYARRTGRDATVEYVLVAGVNDAPGQAAALATLVRGRHLHVNLIPLNPVAHAPGLRAPSEAAARAFARRLREAGVSTTLRRRRGEDIEAACGQLALERSVGGESLPGATGAGQDGPHGGR